MEQEAEEGYKGGWKWKLELLITFAKTGPRACGDDVVVGVVRVVCFDTERGMMLVAVLSRPRIGCTMHVRRTSPRSRSCGPICAHVGIIAL